MIAAWRVFASFIFSLHAAMPGTWRYPYYCTRGACLRPSSALPGVGQSFRGVRGGNLGPHPRPGFIYPGRLRLCLLLCLEITVDKREI